MRNKHVESCTEEIELYEELDKTPVTDMGKGREKSLRCTNIMCLMLNICSFIGVAALLLVLRFAFPVCGKDPEITKDLKHGKFRHGVFFKDQTVKRLEDPHKGSDNKRCNVKDLRDCVELDRSVCPSGIYNLQLDSLTKFDVYCEMDKYGGGWTVIQRRFDGQISFYRDWETYKHGFGDLKKEFWLGNEKIHQLTKKGNNMLRVDLEDFDDNLRFAKYGTFFVGDESSGYKLTIKSYSGNAGDSLSYHSGYKFSTIDVDNDAASGVCTQIYKGAWWYKHCRLSNLNGLYLKGNHSSFTKGMNWNTWRGYNYSLQKTELMIKKLP